MKAAAILSALTFAVGAAAHGAVTSYVIDGVNYPGYQGFSPSPSYNGIELQWPDYNPSTSTASTTRCNGGTSAPSFAQVRPGASVRALWAQWTHVPATVAVYLYPCSSFPCSMSGAQWFKIDEAAILSGTAGGEDWAGNTVIKTGGWTSTFPSNLKAGKYIMRHEIVARHQANNPQFYAECAQIEVTGSGSGFPDSSYQVAIPSTQYANPSDNMLNFEVNGSTLPASSYKVHGPPVWGKGGVAPTGGVTTTSTVRPPTTTTTTNRPPTTTTTTVSPPATTGSTNCSAKYGQCGGIGFNGSTCCQSGSTCKVSNPYYSQCL